MWHEGSVRDPGGRAESISSYVSVFPTIQVYPELDGFILDIIHCFHNIAKKSLFQLTLTTAATIHFFFMKKLASQSMRWHKTML